MCIYKIITLNILIVLCNAIFIKEDPIVETKLGIVKGKTVHSRSGMPFYAFQGIPYAKPPVGDLRFKVSRRSCQKHRTLNSLIDSRNP